MTQHQARIAARVLLAIGVTGASAAGAQEYPTRPITFVAAAGTGSAVDLYLRVLVSKFAERTGWQTVVENRPGGNFVPSAVYVLQQPADGHTILQYTAALPILPYSFKAAPFDVLKDFAFIVRNVDLETMLVAHPSIPAKNLKELLAYAKANPGKLTYGGAGANNSTTLTIEHLKLVSGLQAEFVNYKTGTAVIPDLLAGRIDLGATSVGNSLADVRSGKLRAILLLQSARSKVLPDIESTTDAGFPDVDGVGWTGLAAPVKTPRAVIDRLYREMVPALKSAEVRDAYAKVGGIPIWESPDEFRRKVEADMEKWGKVIRDAKLKFE